MTKFYYLTKNNGKCGCAFTKWHVTDEYTTKAALKKRHSDIKSIYTEAQLVERWGEANAVKIMDNAVEW